MVEQDHDIDFVKMWFRKELLALSTAICITHATTPKQPNIVLILTDDQDNWSSLDYMPLLQKHIADQGTTFNHHYCTVAICCPSRVNIWTGQAAHNTNVTDLFVRSAGMRADRS